MSRYLSRTKQELKPYTPGEQPQGRTFIKLNTNESPFPPSPEVARLLLKGRGPALGRKTGGEMPPEMPPEIADLRLYCDPAAEVLVKEIADYYGVSKRQVIVGNGSDEILAFAFLAFCDGDTPLQFPELTYGFYPVLCQMFGIPARVVPVEPDFTIDIGPYLDCGCNVILANPNAPTGLTLPLSDIEKILDSNRDHVVLIDEAYVDFGSESAVSLLERHENLAVIQTFSKSRCLAGGRVGFAVASEELTDDMNRIKFSFNPYNVNRLSMLAAAAAMGDRDYLRQCAEKICSVRDWTAAQLRELGLVVLDSKTNFLFVKCDALGGGGYFGGLRENGILVRWWETPQIRDYVRISVGTEEDMKALVAVTKKLLRQRTIYKEEGKSMENGEIEPEFETLADCRAKGRQAAVERNTTETRIRLDLNLDGSGYYDIETGCGFLNHMLELFARHGRFDLRIRCEGDIRVDYHHTTEDVGRVLGMAFARAIGDKRGIRRYGSFLLPMDEALVLAAVDISGRPLAVMKAEIPSQKAGDFDTELVGEFMTAFAQEALLTLHLRMICGENSHHIIEAMFKGLGRALKDAVSVEEEYKNEIPSTKGLL